MMFSYSLSLPLDSFHRRYMTEASTLAGLEVFGSFSSDITDSRIVLWGAAQKWTVIITPHRGGVLSMSGLVRFDLVRPDI